MLGIKIEDHHLHASVEYGPISWRHFLRLLISMIVGKISGVVSVTTHLPLEIQHPDTYPNFVDAIRLLKFGESIKSIFRIQLYWENSPLLNIGTWDLKHGQTKWEFIPRNIDLCLDTGHLMLGVRSVAEARKKLQTVLRQRGGQIKHLHVHENDFKSDQHIRIGKVISKRSLKLFTSNRTFIFEK